GATVDEERLACHVLAEIAGQIQDRARNVHGLRDSAPRYCGGARVDLLVGATTTRLCGVSCAGCDRIDGDAILSKSERQRFGYGDDACLARTIVRTTNIRRKPGARRDVDDPARALRHHQSRGLLRAEE